MQRLVHERRSAVFGKAAGSRLETDEETKRRLVGKLINQDHHRTLREHLHKEMEKEEEKADQEKGFGVAASHSQPDTASDTAAAVRHSPSRLQQPRPASTQCVRGARESNEVATRRPAYFRPIRERSPEVRVRDQLAAVKDEHELAPSEVDFLEEVLLDALNMPRNRRTDGAAAAKYAYSPEFENGVIQRQRKELHCLVGELRERDRELNDMVSAHQRQMAGWEADRRRCVQLEEKCRKLEGEIQERQAQIKTLFAKLAEAEKVQEDRVAQLAQYHERLGKMAAEHATTKGVVEEVEEANEVMEDRIKELSSTIGLMEAREQEMMSEIKNKDAEMMHVHQELGDVTARWKTAESQLRASEQSAASLRQQVAELNAYITETKKDCDTLRGEVSKLAQENADLVEGREKLQRDLMQAKKDAELAAERERRKDDLIQSQRLKQERSDAELAHLRHLYERMQQDLANLQLEASSSGLCSEDMLDRRANSGPSTSLPVAGLPPRPRSAVRNGGPAPVYPPRASSTAPRTSNGHASGDPSVDALTRQHLEEYRARYTPVLSNPVPNPPLNTNLTRVSSLPDLSPRDFVHAALSASKQSKMARVMNGGGL